MRVKPLLFVVVAVCSLLQYSSADFPLRLLDEPVTGRGFNSFVVFTFEKMGLFGGDHNESYKSGFTKCQMHNYLILRSAI